MSREQDTISVIIPAYNECPGLVAGVDLILAQTVKPLEIIIVHSGSHDPSRALAGRDPGSASSMARRACLRVPPATSPAITRKANGWPSSTPTFDRRRTGWRTCWRRCGAIRIA